MLVDRKQHNCQIMIFKLVAKRGLKSYFNERLSRLTSKLNVYLYYSVHIFYNKFMSILILLHSFYLQILFSVRMSLLNCVYKRTPVVYFLCLHLNISGQHVACGNSKSCICYTIVKWHYIPLLKRKFYLLKNKFS